MPDKSKYALIIFLNTTIHIAHFIHCILQFLCQLFLLFRTSCE